MGGGGGLGADFGNAEANGVINDMLGVVNGELLYGRAQPLGHSFSAALVGIDEDNGKFLAAVAPANIDLADTVF